MSITSTLVIHNSYAVNLSQSWPVASIYYNAVGVVNQENSSLGF